MRGKYRDVTPPMTVLRRFDAVLEESNIRLWIMGYDWLEAIVGLPLSNNARVAVEPGASG